MQRTIFYVLAMTSAVALSAACIMVDNDNCVEGRQVCTDDLVEECIDDSWWIVDDCWQFCRGTCDYVSNDDPACIC